jgi:RimJ/RimL family protein N-acetyltransferase
MITGERIMLRAWEKGDKEFFWRWFNDPEVTIFLGNAYPAISLEQEERFFDNPPPGDHLYSIIIRESGILIGNCSLHRVDSKNRSAEVGIVIGEKDYWSLGYGRETLRLLQEIAFEGMGINRLALRHVDLNERGHRCYMAAGFVEEARLRQVDYIKGAFHDEVIMSMLAEEYFARKEAEAQQSERGKGTP